MKGTSNGKRAAQELRRPSSANATAKWGGREMGETPWVASIGGGIHTSYTAIGQPQVQPILADPRRSARSTPPAPAAPGFELKVAIPSAHGLVDKRDLPTPVDPFEHLRRLTFCPRMRAKGYCRLPSCTFVHEVCRPRREFDPLYCANAPRFCSMLPCRFLAVLGCCPHGESCIYSHDIAPLPPPSDPSFQVWSSEVPAQEEAEEEKEEESAQPEALEDTQETFTRTLSQATSRATSQISSVEMPRPKVKVPKTPCRARVPRPRSSKRDKPILPQMASLGCPPDLPCPGKDRPVSGGIPVLNMMADRRVCVIAG